MLPGDLAAEAAAAPVADSSSCELSSSSSSSSSAAPAEADVALVVPESTPKRAKNGGKGSKKQKKPEWFDANEIAEKRVKMKELLLHLAHEQRNK